MKEEEEEEEVLEERRGCCRRESETPTTASDVDAIGVDAIDAIAVGFWAETEGMRCIGDLEPGFYLCTSVFDERTSGKGKKKMLIAKGEKFFFGIVR